MIIQDKVDIRKVQRLINYLKENKIEKFAILVNALDSCNYYELEVLFSKIPVLYKGLFSLSFLVRKKYADLCRKSMLIYKDYFDYIGILAYIIKHNDKTINRYLSFRKDFELSLINGDYVKARKQLEVINREVSFSYWSINNEIKLDLLLNGQKSAIECHNRHYFENNNCLLQKYCNASFYTSTIDDVAEIHKKLRLSEENEDSSLFADIVKSHCIAYENKGIGDWMFYDLNTSIIDVYNNFINILSNLEIEAYKDENLLLFISDVSSKIEDPYLQKVVSLCRINNGIYVQTKERASIFNEYLLRNYKVALELANSFLISSPLDIDVLLVKLKCEAMLVDKLDKYNSEGSIYEQICYHLFLMYKCDIDTSFHLRKTKAICQSFYNIFALRHLYSHLLAFEKKDMYGMCDDLWRFSYLPNIGDTVCFKSQKEKKDFLEQQNIGTKIIDSIFDLPVIPLTPEYYELSIGYQHNETIFERIKCDIENQNVTNYVKDAACTYIFEQYCKNNELVQAVIFYANELVRDPSLDIIVNKDQRDAVISQQDLLVKSIPLELSIFLYKENAPIETVYLSYKNYLRTIGVKVASEISKIENEKQLYFLRFIASQKVITLHVLRFKTIEDVMHERIKICSLLRDSYDEKKYSDEIAEIIRDMRILEYNNKVVDNKIYVDVQSIKDTELEEAKSLYKLYEQSSGKTDILEQSINQIAKALAESGLYVNVINTNTERIDYQFDVLKRMFSFVRDQFLLNPKSGLDNYLSTRIRHGTLTNQLRNHFETDNLITNKKNGEYTINDYWVNSKFNLRNQLALSCSKRFSDFAERIDGLILDIKDQYIQVSTENIKNKDKACFSFDIDCFEENLKQLQIRTELNSYEAILSEMLNLLWLHTDQCLDMMHSQLTSSQNCMLEELSNLEKDVTEIVGRENQSWSCFHDAITQCTNNLQNDIRIVNRWFNRTNSTDFTFTIGQVLDSCQDFITRNNKFVLKPVVDIKSETIIHGKFFATLYDMFHDILNNVLYYARDKNVGKECKIDILEINDYFTIRVSNPIEKEYEKEILEKVNDINANLDSLFMGGRSRTEGNSGCIKIFNAVHNHLGSHKNSYINSVENGYFIVKLELEIKPLRK